MTTVGARPRPTGGFELWAWVFMRVSGLLLLGLALGHLAIMHLLTSVEQINYAFVATRFAKLGWRVYDLVLLALALLHGLNGLRTILDDYLHAPRARRVALVLLSGLGVTLLALGAWVIIAFEPVEAPG